MRLSTNRILFERHTFVAFVRDDFHAYLEVNMKRMKPSMHGKFNVNEK